MYVRSLASVQRSDYETAGIIASDLALLREHKFSMPLGFVVTSEAFNAFLEKNGLKNRIIQLYHGVMPSETTKLNELYAQVKRLFLSSELPSEFASELMETYHSLGITGSGADSIIGGSNNPRVLVFKSPGYVIDETDYTGIFMNVKGEEILLKAVLACWASLFSPQSLQYRLENNIRFPDSCGVVIQEFSTEGRCCKVDVDNTQISVESYFGLPDLHKELVKDEHVLDKEFLHILQSKINYQEYKIAVSEGSLVRKRLNQLGNEQKFNDKEIMECGRIAKRCSSFVQKNLSLLINLRNGFNILWAYRKTTSNEPVIKEEPTSNEIETIEKISSDIELFEESNKGEEIETEVTFNEVEVPELFEEEKTPEEVKVEEYEPEPEKVVNDDWNPSEDDMVFPTEEEVTEESYQEVEEFIPKDSVDTLIPEVEEKPVFEEESIIPSFEEEPVQEKDNFIMPVEEEFIQVQAEEKKEFKSNEVFKSIEYDATSIIVKVDHAIYDTLKRKHYQYYQKDVNNVYQIIDELKQKMHVPMAEDVKKVRRLRDEFLEKGKLLSNDEIKYVLDVGKKFFNELR